jgi:methyltransferase family protein
MMPAILPNESTRLPSRIVKSAWLEHAPFAHWLVDALRPSSIVELGTHNGFSFCCFLEQMQRSAIDGRAIAVDTWEGDEHAGAYSDRVYDELASYVASRFPDMAELKRMYFADALPAVPDRSVDLLHVDGRHYYDDVVEDYTSWIPKLSERAVVLFHDTQVREGGFGVHRYWAEISARHQSFEFHHCNGLGVLGFGSNFTKDVMALFRLESAGEDAEITRQAFAAAGAQVTKVWERKRFWQRKTQQLQRLLGAKLKQPRDESPGGS